MTAFDDLPERERKRILQDEDTLRVMGRIYCGPNHLERHKTDGLCAECSTCIEYAIERTRACPNLHKGNCEACDIKCYKPDMRTHIRTIMAYAGPRMAFRHPVMAVRHLRKKMGK